MLRPAKTCPDCDSPIVLRQPEFDRRDFLKTAGAASLAAVAAGPLSSLGRAAEPADTSPPESLVKVLYDTLTRGQREKLCFDWDFKHPQHGLLRTRVANNWHITEPEINSDFFTGDQQAIIRDDLRGHHPARLARPHRPPAR